MSLWPVKVAYDEVIVTRRTETFEVDYAEFAEWSGTHNLHDCDDEDILDFLQAGDELWNKENVELVSRHAYRG